MTLKSDSKLHRFQERVVAEQLPERFTNPFWYVPHGLVRRAAEMVMAKVSADETLNAALMLGKMLGVMVVADCAGEVGFLAAYSGNVLGSNSLSYFVGPVFDMLQPDGEFCVEERAIVEINHEIERREQSEALADSEAAVAASRERVQREVAALRGAYADGKAERARKRATGIGEAEEAQLLSEAQYAKAELRRDERVLKAEVMQAQAQLTALQQEIEALREERKERSAQLQGWLFKQFVVHNGEGESCTLFDIFENQLGALPPAGAGECAGIKLLEHAYVQGYKPLAMGEFWCGASPQGVVRHHLAFYPSCQSKCAPILGYMLQGVAVDAPLQGGAALVDVLPEVVYEDEWLCVVNKPSGQLSVPGCEGGESVQEQVQRLRADAKDWLAVHRLDMSTSGLLVLAKTKNVYIAMQQEFASRRIKKRYTALLQGVPEQRAGVVELPLCADVSDRPRQMVSYEHGKASVTRYEVREVRDGRALVWFWPESGRTHQLRVHAAHASGLNCPIVGDALYGNAGKRLCLHAAALGFKHPVSGEWITLEREADFWKE